MENQHSIIYQMEKLKRDECKNIVETERFMSDPLISEIMYKAIELGYDLDIIKEIFCNFLVENLKTNKNLENINYGQIIDHEKFIEQLIHYCSQNQTNSNTNGSGINSVKYNSEFNEETDDNLDENISNFNEEDFNEFENLNSYNFTKDNHLKGKEVVKPSCQLNKKPISENQKHQLEQDYFNNQQKRVTDPNNLRPIIVDGKDVALITDHSNKQTFLMNRIRKVVDFFEKRKHQIYLILSQSRRDQIIGPNFSLKTPDQQILLEMEAKNQVYYTPSKRVGTKKIEQDEDHVKLQLAEGKGAVIVSNNNFKKYLNHTDEFKLVIEERVLMYSFIEDTFMPDEFPLGKNGPSLDNFLRIEQSMNSSYFKRCPYKKKCTYGAKCKFLHPERGNFQGNQIYKTAHQNVLETVQENKQKLRLEVILNKQPDNHLLTRKLLVNPFEPIKQDTNFDFDLHTDFGSLSIAQQLHKNPFEINHSSQLRAMGPDQVFNPGQMNMIPKTIGSEQKKLTSLLAQQTSLVKNTDNYSAMNFLDKYGSSTFNNLADFSNKSTDLQENNLKVRLSSHLNPIQIEQVIEKYPNETSIEKLVYLARCLTTSEDDF